MEAAQQLRKRALRVDKFRRLDNMAMCEIIAAQVCESNVYAIKRSHVFTICK